MLGAPLDTITLLHYSEHMADIPSKRIARYRMPVLRDGARVWVDIEEYDTEHGIADWPGGDFFAAIGREYLEAGHGRSGLVGAASSHLFDAAGLAAFGKDWMERHLR
jgi:aminoglycoside 3-N-acetyltransferase